MNKFLVVLLVLLNCGALTYAADSPSKSPEPSDKADAAISAKDKETAANLQEAKRALEFGIDSTVLSVITQAIDSKDKRLAPDIEKQFASLNPDVQRAAIEYFVNMQDWSPHDRVEKMLLDYMDWQTPVVQSLLHFLQVEKKPGSTALLKNLVEITDASKPEIQAGAVDAIAACGNKDQVPVLMALFKKSGTATVVRASVIKAFGEFKTDETFALIKEIAEDSSEEKSLRYEALSALGKHGRADSLNTITKSLLSTDVFERGAAINSLGGFELAKVLPQYQQAMRDSFWRNRVTVLKVVAEKKITALVEPVIYLAEKDPEVPVQTEACRTLAVLDLPQAWKLLETQFKNDKTFVTVRGVITELLVNKHFGPSHGIIREVMQTEWTTEKSWMLNVICREVSNLKDPSAADLYDKMLEHPDFQIKIYGVRGIKLNGLLLLKPKLQELLKTNQPAALKSSIEEALK